MVITAPRSRAVALVESPAQLLNVLEWADANRADGTATTRLGEQLTIMVLPPPEPAARLQLDRMTELAQAAGCTVSWHEVRGGHGVRLRALSKIMATVSGSETLVIGDPFSGFLQLVIGMTRTRELVVVDDGSATLRFVEIMESQDNLVRWHRHDKSTAVNRLVAARARRRLAAGTSGRWPQHPLRLFTAMPVTSTSIPTEANVLGWTRKQYPTPRLLPGADLIGSSLVESGVVSQEHYLRAVAALVTGERVGRYLAHRRESNEKLTMIAALGVRVVRPGLPLELFARQGPIAERLISFPSTVVHTLPLALSDTGVEVLVCEVDQAWLTPGLSAGRSGSFLTSVTSTARQTYGLGTALTV